MVNGTLVLNIAHRGASGKFPENTLPAFAAAIEAGAQMCELDAQLTRDGTAVVIHDETVDRTTNGRGAVAAMSLAEIRRLDAGVRNSVSTIFGYIGVIIAALLAGAQIGLDVQKLALIAGGLSVGIGFGLQTIANNFVSGLILLWERTIRVGDLVVVGSDQGFVRSINARATEIETFDRGSLIVPNSTFVSGVVKNWVHNDRVGRIIIAVNITYESDLDEVRDLMIGAAKADARSLHGRNRFADALDGTNGH